MSPARLVSSLRWALGEDSSANVTPLPRGNEHRSSPPPPAAFAHRDAIKRIDQSEFEGFEYINPLLLSTEESV